MPIGEQAPSGSTKRPGHEPQQLGGALEDLGGLQLDGRTPAALWPRPCHLDRLEHPCDGRNGVGDERREERPCRERRRGCARDGVRTYRAPEDDEAEREGVRHGVNQRQTILHDVADRDERGCGYGRNRRQSKPESESSESRGAGREGGRHETQGKEP